MDRDAAITLLSHYVKDDHLVKHCLATGAILKVLAAHWGDDESRWEMIGILHDIDYELVAGDMQQHGCRGAELLLEHGVMPDIAEIIKRHNHTLHNGTYEQRVEIALQAADSVSGLIIACALVKGGQLSLVTAKTVLKKAKERSFAAGCDRNRIALIQPMMDLATFYDIAIQGLLNIRGELGLT
ncbi:MAG: HDIG domain-containing protein [Methanoregula sp.]|nr:HDIG domain-containing protein [Methanoregula sp.]